MDDEKAQRLHDTLSKLRKSAGLGTSSQFNFGGASEIVPTKKDKDGKLYREDGLPVNGLYSNFVREGTYDPNNKHNSAAKYGDGRAIKRDFGEFKESKVDWSSDDGDYYERKEKKKLKKSKEERKAEKKAAKLEAKRQAKLEEKKRAKLEAKRKAKSSEKENEIIDKVEKKSKKDKKKKSSKAAKDATCTSDSKDEKRKSKTSTSVAETKSKKKKSKKSKKST